MHKSALSFGLLASSLVMLAIMPFLNQNNSFSMHWLKNMTNMEIVVIANIQPMIRNMNVELVHLKDSLLVQ